MYYLCINGKPIDLECIPYFRDKKATDILNIIKFFNFFEKIEDLINALKEFKCLKPGMVVNKIDITKKEKIKGEIYYRVQNIDNKLLLKNNSKYFDADEITSMILGNINNVLFLKALKEKYGTRVDTSECVNFMCNMDKNLQDRICYAEMFLAKQLYTREGFKSASLVRLGLFLLNFYNNQKKSVISLDGVDSEKEEFLEIDDYLYHNPGATPKVMKDAKERAYTLRYKKSNVN